MKEKLKQLKPIQNMMALALLVFLSILTTQTSAIAQNYAPLPQTGQTQTYAPGDDGDLQIGVQWPDPRFTDNGDGTVTDNLTGLIWLKRADCFGNKNWNDALDGSNKLANGQCGLSDGSSPGNWRLPNARELLSLIDYGNYSPALPSGHPFIGVHSDNYWSSTTVAGRIEAALLVNIVPEPDFEPILHDAPKNQSRGVWPVRGGNDVVFVAAPVPVTGQTESYALGDDGDLQMGVQWPDPRLTDNGDGTVTDNLTGLIWLKHADCFGNKNWNDALDGSNKLANGQCGLSDGSSPGNWRLSNIRELRSLIDHGNISSLLPFGHPFTGVQSDDYWSSTTYVARTDDAWIMPVGESPGYFDGTRYSPKDNSYRVWPVRDVQIIKVDIDIKPGSYPNSINLKSNGVIPVAILSTSSFDATQEVDRNSLTFGKTGDEDSLAFCRGSEDVNGDSILDLVCHFYNRKTAFSYDDTQGVLRGTLVGGIPIMGRDSVRIVPSKKISDLGVISPNGGGGGGGGGCLISTTAYGFHRAE